MFPLWSSTPIIASDSVERELPTTVLERLEQRLDALEASLNANAV